MIIILPRSIDRELIKIERSGFEISDLRSHVTQDSKFSLARICFEYSLGIRELM